MKATRITIFLTILVGCIIAQQLFLINELYVKECNTNRLNIEKLLNKIITSYNNKSIKKHCYAGYNNEQSVILFSKHDSIFQYQITGIDTNYKEQVLFRASYDIRDTSLWKLACIDEYLHENIDSLMVINKLVLYDNNGVTLDQITRHNAASSVVINTTLGVFNPHTLALHGDFSKYRFIRLNKNSVAVIIFLICIIFVLFFVIYYTYITEKQLNEYHKNLSESNLHDLKSPLNGIQRKLFLVDCLLDNNQISDAKSILKEQSTQINDFIKSIDLYLRVAVTGKGIKLDITNIDIQQLIDNTLTQHKQNTVNDNKKINYLLENNTNVKFLKGDPLHLSRCIMNLLDNAIKYAYDSVKVVIQCHQNQTHFFISIKDNGCGISAENMDRIFDKYYRVQATKKACGFGVGLYYVHNVMNAHKGDIKVNSILNEGSEFIISLPLSK
ncbi:MAG: sensor histidine kinase [Marinifilaceae bacterium]